MTAEPALVQALRPSAHERVPPVEVRPCVDLAFARDATGRSYLGRQYVGYPVHVGRALHVDGSAPDLCVVYLQSVSGGLFEHERLAGLARRVKGGDHRQLAGAIIQLAAPPDIAQGVLGDALGEKRIVLAQRFEHGLPGAAGQVIHHLDATFVALVAGGFQRGEGQRAEHGQAGRGQGHGAPQGWVPGRGRVCGASVQGGAHGRGASQWGCGSGFLTGEPALPRIAALFHEPPPSLAAPLPSLCPP